MIVFEYDIRRTSDKSRNQQVGLNQTKKLVHKKEVINKMKSQHKTEENICKSPVWFHIQNVMTKIQTILLKSGQKIWIFFQQRHASGQQVQKKMF